MLTDWLFFKKYCKRNCICVLISPNKKRSSNNSEKPEQGNNEVV
jgi:hypothetical protein